jgi:hypothetical protein
MLLEHIRNVVGSSAMVGVRQAAVICNVTPDTIRAYVNAGIIPKHVADGRGTLEFDLYEIFDMVDRRVFHDPDNRAKAKNATKRSLKGIREEAKKSL